MSPLPPMSAMSPVPEDGQPPPALTAGRRSRRSSTVSCSGRRSRLGSESAGEGGVGDRVQVGCIMKIYHTVNRLRSFVTSSYSVILSFSHSVISPFFNIVTD